MLQTYLAQHLVSETASNIVLQSMQVKNEIKTRQTADWEIRGKPLILYGALSSVAGILAPLGLSLLGTLFLLKLPFSFFPLAHSDNLARAAKFWFLTIVGVGVGTWVLAQCLIAWGPDEIGFGFARPKPFISWYTRAWISALSIVVILCALNFCFRRKNNPNVQLWFNRTLLMIAYGYLLAVVLAAYFRAQTVSRIGYDYF